MYTYPQAIKIHDHAKTHNIKHKAKYCMSLYQVACSMGPLLYSMDPFKDSLYNSATFTGP